MPQKAKSKAKNKTVKKSSKKTSKERDKREEKKSSDISSVKIISVSKKGLEKAIDALEQEEEIKGFSEFVQSRSTVPINTGLEQIAPIQNRSVGFVPMTIKYDGVDQSYGGKVGDYATGDQSYSASAGQHERSSDLMSLREIQEQKDVNAFNFKKVGRITKYESGVDSSDFNSCLNSSSRSTFF